MSKPKREVTKLEPWKELRRRTGRCQEGVGRSDRHGVLPETPESFDLVERMVRLSTLSVCLERRLE